MNSAITVCAIALVPYFPMRRPSPERSRSRIASRLVATPATSSPRPSTKLAPIQARSVGAPNRSSTTERIPNRTKTAPRAASRAERFFMSAPPHRLDGGLGEDQEGRHHRREVRQVLGVDEAHQHALEAVAGREETQHAA